MMTKQTTKKKTVKKSLTYMAFRLCEFVDGSKVLHDVQILCRIPRIHMAFHRCVYVRDFSNEAIVRTAYRTLNIYRKQKINKENCKTLIR